MVNVVIVGGGPGGYEAALVARAAGAEVTLVERQGLGGNAVLTDVVPSKTVIATAEWLTIADRAGQLGIRDSRGHATGGAVHHTRGPRARSTSASPRSPNAKAPTSMRGSNARV